MLDDYKPPTMIDKEEWIGYNEYLTSDNPFLNITSYEEGMEIYFAEMYELNERIAIVKNQQAIAKVEGEEFTDADKEINDIEAAFIKLNNQFIALQCYKVCIVIRRIEYFDHSFDYDKAGLSWKGLMDMLEEVENK